MMPLGLYLAFLAASAVLLLIPGPNVALIVSTSIGRGRRHGLVTVAGTSSAMVFQLGLAIAGLSAMLTISAALFAWLRWAGVLYLCCLALRAWFAPVRRSNVRTPAAKSLVAVYVRGFLISLTNPKTLFFYGAFFPQFVSVGAPLLPQLLTLSASFLVLAIVFDGTWAILAGRLGSFLVAQGRLRYRLEAAFLFAAGLGLALARRT
jgi:threonine/homoserine/homoserine lactone efflux protein